MSDPILSLFPIELPQTSTERLLVAADIIEADTNHWDQDYFFLRDHQIVLEGIEDTPDADPTSVAGNPQVIQCDTKFCVAGLGVILTPAEEIEHLDLPTNPGYDWMEAGAHAFDFDRPLAGKIFYTDLTRSETVSLLRDLAALPTPRTLDDAVDAGLVQS